MMVLKRFDDALKETKDAMVEMSKKLDQQQVEGAALDGILRTVAKHDFYNTSNYDFAKLIAEPNNIEENFETYLQGFSENVKDIIEKEDFAPKTFTKQEIGLKTESGYRELPIPDIVFEAILEERQKYERNRSRRINDKTNTFFDGNYICCSTYGRPRSKGFHWKYYKHHLSENGLPDIRWHDLRTTYCTLLLKESFNPKAVSKLMGHAKEIITMDVYADNQNIIADGVPEIEA